MREKQRIAMDKTVPSNLLAYRELLEILDRSSLAQRSPKIREALEKVREAEANPVEVQIYCHHLCSYLTRRDNKGNCHCQLFPGKLRNAPNGGLLRDPKCLALNEEVTE